MRPPQAHHTTPRRDFDGIIAPQMRLWALRCDGLDRGNAHKMDERRPDDVDDETLATRTQAGDREAFGVLVRRHRGAILRICLTAVGQAEDAEDLCHDAFVEAFVKRHQLRDAAKFVPWLKALTRNLCRTALRRQGRMDWQAALRRPPACGSDDGTSGRLRSSYARLSDDHRLALALQYSEDLSYREMAAFLGIPIGTVMSRLSRARHALKRGMVDGEEHGMTQDESFVRDVDTEVDTLVEMFRHSDQPMERLSVILEHSPERLRQLLGLLDEEALRRNVARMLRSLGQPVFDVLLEASFSGDAVIRVPARLLLEEWVGVDRFGRFAGGGRLHRVLDWFLRNETSGPDRAELLVQLALACRETWPRNLLTEYLLCDAEHGFPVLWRRFETARTQAELCGEHQPVLMALCRTGTRFAEALLGALDGRDAAGRLVVLEALAALGRSRHHVHQPGEYSTAAELALMKRGIDNYAPVAEEQMDVHVLEEVRRTVTGLVEHPDASMRNAAVRVLRLPRRSEVVATLMACLEDSDLSTRLEAIPGLGELGGAECVDALARAAESEDGPERKAAGQALGYHRERECSALRAELDGLDPAAQRMEEEQINACLRLKGAEMVDWLRTSDRRSSIEARKAPAHVRLARRGSATTRRRLEKVRGEGRPRFFQSVEAAIRSLPEIRPYDERELTRLIAQECHDYSTTRRSLVMDGEHALMTRLAGVYCLTDRGEAVWRVERYIVQHYLR